MKLVTVSGPPSSGKTSVILRTLECLLPSIQVGVIKFDCLSSFDDKLYAERGIPVWVGLAGNLCPDHFFITNIEDGVRWARGSGLDLLVTESAGLCNRCSPHIKGVTAVCVIDNLSGVDTPKKIGPMLRYADIVAVTKGDIVSQAEREVFAFNSAKANPRASIMSLNGITGQGAFMLSRRFLEAPDIESLEGRRLRFTMPAALCSYCLGQTMIGREFELGSMRKIDFARGR
jgi:Ni2+-binding GTPase involved in maturation of urease and hydrogenase